MAERGDEGGHLVLRARNRTLADRRLSGGPKFNIVSRPNEFVKVGQAARSGGNHWASQYPEYWTKFDQLCQDRKARIQSLAEKIENEGGFTERLYRVRRERRNG